MFISCSVCFQMIILLQMFIMKPLLFPVLILYIFVYGYSKIHFIDVIQKFFVFKYNLFFIAARKYTPQSPDFN